MTDREKIFANIVGLMGEARPRTPIEIIEACTVAILYQSVGVPKFSAYCFLCDFVRTHDRQYAIRELKNHLDSEHPRWMGLVMGIDKAPIDMLLFCPQCGEQHIDEARPDVCETCGGVQDEYTHSSERVCSCPVFTAWLNPPHKSHRCGSCNRVWRPADVATNGVKELRTKGKRDGDPRPHFFASARDLEEAVKETREHGRMLGQHAFEVEQVRGTLFNAILAHHGPRGNDRCWERDVALYRAAGLEPGDPENPPIEEHRRMCDEYRASLFNVPVEGEPRAIVEGLKAENIRLSEIMSREMVFASESNQLRRELEKVTADRDAWKSEREMYARAWQRELGGRIIVKTHLIDALVLTTRRLFEERDRLRARVLRLEALHKPIADTYACHRCGRRDGLDSVVPADIWPQISPTGDEGGILCLWCIDQLCAKKGITCSASLHFAGTAITGTSQSDADRDHIRRVVAQRIALEEEVAQLKAGGK